MSPIRAVADMIRSLVAPRPGPPRRDGRRRHGRTRPTRDDQRIDAFLSRHGG